MSTEISRLATTDSTPNTRDFGAVHLGKPLPRAINNDKTPLFYGRYGLSESI